MKTNQPVTPRSADPLRGRTGQGAGHPAGIRPVEERYRYTRPACRYNGFVTAAHGLGL